MNNAGVNDYSSGDAEMSRFSLHGIKTSHRLGLFLVKKRQYQYVKLPNAFLLVDDCTFGI